MEAVAEAEQGAGDGDAPMDEPSKGGAERKVNKSSIAQYGN
jgi:hypothetical protein